MKKVIVLLMCIALLLAGCGMDVSPAPSTALPLSEAATQTESTAQQTSENVAESEKAATGETLISVKPEAAAITETVILDESGIKITAKSLEYGGWLGPEVKFLIENESDSALTVQCRNASVNGYMVDTSMSADVAAGKKSNDSLTIYQSSLDDCGITEIADIEFSFHIFKSDGWDTYLDSDLIKLETSAAEKHIYTYDDSGEVLFEGNGIKIVSKGFYEDTSYFGRAGLLVYVQNDSGENITIQARDESVNGFMVDTIFSLDVVNGKHAIDLVEFSQYSLDENSISDIETCELYFHIFNADNWDELLNTDPIVITK